jgi:predicted nucleic acid-binding protein
MRARRFLDTNILLYSISRAADEAEKRERAIAILDADDNGLSVQVLQDFYVQATRASRSDPVPHDVAAGLIGAWLRFEVQDNTVAVMRGALEIKAAHGFSYWDSAVVAAARALGCRELLSEDMSHGQVIDGVTIVNPFRD